MKLGATVHTPDDASGALVLQLPVPMVKWGDCVVNEVKLSGALPTFCTCTLCGLSLLGVPTDVLLKVYEGGLLKLTCLIAALPVSETNRLPRPSTATPMKFEKPLPSV